MAWSIEQQRASIHKQVGTAAPRQAAPIATAATTCDPIPQPELSKMIDTAAEKHGVDAKIIREVARQESGFRPCAVSGKGAEGLMQLMPATQSQFQVTDAFDAGQSLEAGTKLLKQLLDKYHGDVSLTLGAYNAGSGTVDRAGGVPDNPETRNYVLEILSRILP
jgi:soluble lytic murein transglycosylase-like protein